MVRLSYQQVLVGFLIILLLFIAPNVRGGAQQEEGQITIVFDFTHDQPFSPKNRNFTKAIEYFEDYPEYFVRILEEGELMAENLSRSHILVISNPGQNYSTSELEVISNYVALGGSLFLLGDFQVAEREIGNPIALNRILQTITETRIAFTTFSNGNKTEGDAIIDANNSLVLPYNVLINSSYINSYPTREMLGMGVNSLIIAGGSLTTDVTDLIISTGSETSEAVTLKGQSLQNQPAWLAAYWKESSNSRIVLCTSTTMFSDTQSTATNQSWFESLDNKILWYNIFRWMSSPLVQDPTPIMIFFVILVMVAGILIFAYSLLRKKRE